MKEIEHTLTHDQFNEKCRPIKYQVYIFLALNSGSKQHQNHKAPVIDLYAKFKSAASFRKELSVGGSCFVICTKNSQHF